MNYHLFDKCLDISQIRVIFVKFLLELISDLLVDTHQNLYTNELVFQLFIHIVFPTWHLEF